MSDLIKNLESAIENGNEKYGFVDMLLLVNCRNEISRLQGIINKALRQQPEPDTVYLSREDAEWCAEKAKEDLALWDGSDHPMKWPNLARAAEDRILRLQQALEKEQ
jgi:hypothetical protein